MLHRWQKMVETLNVSSFFDCFHNTQVPVWFPESRNLLKKLSIYFDVPQLVDDGFEYIVRQSKFMVCKAITFLEFSIVSIYYSHFSHIVIENSILEDYVSEKAWQALHLGAVPIYFGAPNAANILPHGSFINMLKYVTADGSFDMQALKATVDQALESPEVLAQYHAWRLPHVDANFMKLLARFGNTQSFIMNRKVYGDRKRLTCDLCSHISKLKRQKLPGWPLK